MTGLIYTCMCQGVRWQAMSATDKAPFEAQAVADKLSFKKEMDAYEVKVQVVTGDERGRNKSSSSNSEMPAPRRRPNKVKKDPNAPKRAVTSYLFYSHDWREKTKEDCPDLSPQAVMKELGMLSQIGFYFFINIASGQATSSSFGTIQCPAVSLFCLSACLYCHAVAVHSLLAV